MPSKNQAQGPGHVVWTEEMRTALVLLNSEFDFTPLETAWFFQKLFADYLRQLNLSLEKLCSALISQWRSRNDKRSPKRWKQWQTKCRQRCPPEEKELRKTLTLRIKRIAKSHGRDDSSEDPLNGPRTTASGIKFRSSSNAKISQSQAPVLADGNQDSSDPDPGPSRKRPKSSGEATLLSGSHQGINGDTAIVTSPSKARAIRQSNRSELPKIPYPRPDDKFRNGKILLLTEKDHEATGTDLKPVDKKTAHPRLAPLCYRCVEF